MEPLNFALGEEANLLENTREPNEWDLLKHVVRRVNGVLMRYDRSGAGQLVSVGGETPLPSIGQLKVSLDRLICTQVCATGSGGQNRTRKLVDNFCGMRVLSRMLARRRCGRRRRRRMSARTH